MAGAGKPRPLLILPRAEPTEVTALIPDGPPRRFCWRGVTYEVTGSKARNASPANGGARATAIARRSRRAIITSSRIPAAAASGSFAKDFTGARRRRRAGSCTGCLREFVRVRTQMSAYAELAVTTNFSFLRGASHPQEMVATADELGCFAIGIADRNSFAGVVRAYDEAKNRKIKLLVGVRLVTTDGFEVLAYPTDRAAYGRLCKLLTTGNLKAKKGECHLTFEEILGASEGQMFIALAAAVIYPPHVNKADGANVTGILRGGRGASSTTIETTTKRRLDAPSTHAAHGPATPRSAGTMNISPPASPPSPAPRRAAPSSPACIIIAATSRAGSGFWPNSASASARRSSPSTTFPITCRSAGRSPTCSPACARNARFAEAGLRLAVNAERHLKAAGGDGAAVQKLSRRHRPHDRDRQSLHLLARRTEIRISRRAGAGRQNRAAAS